MGWLWEGFRVVICPVLCVVLTSSCCVMCVSFVLLTGARGVYVLAARREYFEGVVAALVSGVAARTYVSSISGVALDSSLVLVHFDHESYQADMAISADAGSVALLSGLSAAYAKFSATYVARRSSAASGASDDGGDSASSSVPVSLLADSSPTAAAPSSSPVSILPASSGHSAVVSAAFLPGSLASSSADLTSHLFEPMLPLTLPPLKVSDLPVHSSVYDQYGPDIVVYTVDHRLRRWWTAIVEMRLSFFECYSGDSFAAVYDRFLGLVGLAPPDPWSKIVGYFEAEMVAMFNQLRIVCRSGFPAGVAVPRALGRFLFFASTRLQDGPRYYDLSSLNNANVYQDMWQVVSGFRAGFPPSSSLPFANVVRRLVDSVVRHDLDVVALSVKSVKAGPRGAVTGRARGFHVRDVVDQCLLLLNQRTRDGAVVSGQVLPLFDALPHTDRRIEPGKGLLDGDVAVYNQRVRSNHRARRIPYCCFLTEEQWTALYSSSQQSQYSPSERISVDELRPLVMVGYGAQLIAAVGAYHACPFDAVWESMSVECRFVFAVLAARDLDPTHGPAFVAVLVRDPPSPRTMRHVQHYIAAERVWCAMWYLRVALSYRMHSVWKVPYSELPLEDGDSPDAGVPGSGAITSAHVSHGSAAAVGGSVVSSSGVAAASRGGSESSSSGASAGSLPSPVASIDDRRRVWVHVLGAFNPHVLSLQPYIVDAWQRVLLMSSDEVRIHLSRIPGTVTNVPLEGGVAVSPYIAGFRHIMTHLYGLSVPDGAVSAGALLQCNSIVVNHILDQPTIWFMEALGDTVIDHLGLNLVDGCGSPLPAGDVDSVLLVRLYMYRDCMSLVARHQLGLPFVRMPYWRQPLAVLRRVSHLCVFPLRFFFTSHQVITGQLTVARAAGAEPLGVPTGGTAAIPAPVDASPPLTLVAFREALLVYTPPADASVSFREPSAGVVGGPMGPFCGDGTAGTVPVGALNHLHGACQIVRGHVLGLGAFRPPDLPPGALYHNIPGGRHFVAAPVGPIDAAAAGAADDGDLAPSPLQLDGDGVCLGLAPSPPALAFPSPVGGVSPLDVSSHLHAASSADARLFAPSPAIVEVAVDAARSMQGVVDGTAGPAAPAAKPAAAASPRGFAPAVVPVLAAVPSARSGRKSAAVSSAAVSASAAAAAVLHASAAVAAVGAPISASSAAAAAVPGVPGSSVAVSSRRHSSRNAASASAPAVVAAPRVVAPVVAPSAVPAAIAAAVAVPLVVPAVGVAPAVVPAPVVALVAAPVAVAAVLPAVAAGSVVGGDGLRHSTRTGAVLSRSLQGSDSPPMRARSGRISSSGNYAVASSSGFAAVTAGLAPSVACYDRVVPPMVFAPVDQTSPYHLVGQVRCTTQVGEVDYDWQCDTCRVPYGAGVRHFRCFHGVDVCLSCAVVPAGGGGLCVVPVDDDSAPLDVWGRSILGAGEWPRFRAREAFVMSSVVWEFAITSFVRVFYPLVSRVEICVRICYFKEDKICAVGSMPRQALQLGQHQARLSTLWRLDPLSRKSAVCSRCGPLCAALSYYFCPDPSCHHALCFLCYSRVKFPDDQLQMPTLDSYSLPAPAASCASCLPHGPAVGCPDLSFVIDPTIVVGVYGVGPDDPEPKGALLSGISSLDVGCGFYPFAIESVKCLAQYDPGVTAPCAALQRVVDGVPLVEARRLFVHISGHMSASGIRIGSDVFTSVQLMDSLIVPIVASFRLRHPSSPHPVVVFLHICDLVSSTWQTLLDACPVDFSIVMFCRFVPTAGLTALLRMVLLHYSNALHWSRGRTLAEVFTLALGVPYCLYTSPYLLSRGCAPLSLSGPSGAVPPCSSSLSSLVPTGAAGVLPPLLLPSCPSAPCAASSSSSSSSSVLAVDGLGVQSSLGVSSVPAGLLLLTSTARNQAVSAALVTDVGADPTHVLREVGYCDLLSYLHQLAASLAPAGSVYPPFVTPGVRHRPFIHWARQHWHIKFGFTCDLSVFTWKSSVSSG